MAAAKARAGKAIRTRSRRGASRRRVTRRASTSAPRSSSSSAATRESADGTQHQEGAIHRSARDQEGRGDEPLQPEESGEDLVAALDHRAGAGGPHLRGAQWAQVHPGVRDGEHGRAQARRVRSDAHLPRAHRRQEGSEARRSWRTAGDSGSADARRRASRARAEVRNDMEAKAELKYLRIRPRKGRRVAYLIPGRKGGAV